MPSAFEPGNIPPDYLWCGRSAQSSIPGAVFVAIFVFVWLAYAIAIIKGRGEVKRFQALCFGGGIALGLLVSSGPVERLSLQRSFLIYVFQQFVLVMVVAPLLLSGVPGWMLSRVVKVKWLIGPWRLLTNPVVAFAVFASIFALVHLPTICDHICHIHAYYYSVRVLLLVAGVILWWPLLSPVTECPRLSYPVRILYLFLLMIPMTAVAAPIALSRQVFYDFYLPTPHPFGLTAVDDQILGGLLMWVGQGLYLLVCATVVFARWVARENAGESADGIFESASALASGDAL